MAEEEEREAWGFGRERAARLRARADQQLLDELEAPTRARERAVANAAAFLRAGGAISWDRWRSLDEPSRAALVEAGEDVAQDRAILVARALVALQPVAATVREKTHDEIIDEAMSRAGRSALERAAGE